MARRKQTPKAVVKEWFVDTSRGLNLREGPGLDRGIVKLLPDQTPVTLRDVPVGQMPATPTEGWLPVSALGLEGWVMARFLGSREVTEDGST